MKRFLFALLLLSITSILADQSCMLNGHQPQGIGPIEIDGLVYSQTYDFGLISGSGCIEGVLDRWLCDDFILDNDYYLSDVHVWMIWTDEQATQMNFVISEDDLLDWDPNTNTDVWAESAPCTNTFTGDSNWGYEIYETHCVIDIRFYPELYAEKHYYFEVQADVTDCCLMLLSPAMVGDYCWYDNGSGVWIRSDVAFGGGRDVFFDFYGEPVNTMESETWGSIKTLF